MKKKRFPRTEEPEGQVPIRTLQSGAKFKLHLFIRGPMYNRERKGEVVYLTRGGATVQMEDHSSKYEHWCLDTLVIPEKQIKRFPRTIKRFPRTPKKGSDGHFRFPRT